MVCRNSPTRLSSSLALLSGKKCIPVMRMPAIVRSSGRTPARVSLSKPNCEGVPVIRMLLVALAVALLTRSRQSAVAPFARAASATWRTSETESVEKTRTPSRIASASSPGVLPGPV